MKCVYKGDFSIAFNGRDVEMEVEATALWEHSYQTYWEPEYSEFTVEDVDIKNAHYADTDEPIDASEIVDEVIDALTEMDDDKWLKPREYYEDDYDYEEDRYEED